MEDGVYLTKDGNLAVVEGGKPARAYDVGGVGWLFGLFADPTPHPVDHEALKKIRPHKREE
jgi:hypothetical protein